MKHFFTIFVFVSMLTFSISFAQIDWIKQGSTVLDPGAEGEWDDNIIGPFCILFEDTLYRMWYVAHDGANWAIGYATSEDGLIWTKFDDPSTTDPPYAQSDPVLLPGPTGSWDSDRIGNPDVHFADGVYKMWYSGTRGTKSQIGYATSADGITWSKYENNPVLNNGPTGSWKEGGVSQPCVRFDVSTYQMWYGGWPVPDNPTSIGYATSTNGINWDEHPENPVFTTGNGWDSEHVESPYVLFDGNIYHMWYTGRNTASWFQWRIGYALSANGIDWTKFASNPVLTPSAGSWDSQWVGMPKVILNSADSTFKMLYLGGAADWDSHVGYATASVSYEAICEYTFLSKDSVKFTDKSIGIITDWLWDFDDGSTSIERNPVHAFEPGEYTITLSVSGPFGSDDSTFQLIVTDILEQVNNIPMQYALNQNYPNPFNPKTVICYSLSVASHLDLSIYNILGQKVATLVNKKQLAGSYQVTWNASGFVSGVYLYRLETNNGYSQTKKLVVLK